MFSTGFRDTESQITPELAKKISKQQEVQVSRTGEFVWFISDDWERLEQMKADFPDLCQCAIQKHYLD